MKLVQFSTTEGQVWINPDHVTAVEVASQARSFIRLGAKASYLINARAEKVVQRLQEYGDV